MNYNFKSIMLFLFCACNIAINAQNRTITGVVSDQNGNTIPGVNIIIKGDKSGTITDLNGKYTIKVPQENITLVYSYIGYITKAIKVSGNVLNVTLEETENSLDEIVVVGYGSQVKTNLTGSVQSISTKELESRPITNLSAGLQGLVSGVEVLQSGGEPGNDFGTIRIRGVNNIENNSNPLVIIDGMEGNINQVDPKDIQSMSVLKDASSAAIYGNRAAGGVIIITTKSGQIGKMKISFSTNFASQQATALPDIVDAYRWNSLYNETNDYSGTYDATADNNEAALKSGIRVPVNWYDEYYSVAPLQNHYLSIAGGSKNFKGSVSVGVLNQEGILFNTIYKKYTFRSNTDAWLLNNRLNIKTNLYGFIGDKGENHTPASSMIDIINKRNPSTTFRSINGIYTSSALDFAIKQFGGITNRKNYLVNGRVSANLKVLQFGKHNLSINGSYGGTISNEYFLDYVPEYVTSADLEGTNITKREGTILKTWGLTTNILSDATINYDLKEKNYKISMLAGYSETNYKVQTVNLSRTKMFANRPIVSMGDPATMSNLDAEYGNTTRSFFGRATLNWKDRYLLEANCRYDGSSRFPTGRKWGVFPSVSAGWRVSEEKFFDILKSKNYVSNLKLRASWGSLGHESLPGSNTSSYYAGSDIMTTSPYDFGNSAVSGVSGSTIAVKTTTWETTEQVNVGVDMNFLKFFDLTVDVYSKKTKDILFKIPMPLSLGMGDNNDPYQNMGNMSNRGIDIDLGYKVRLLKKSLGIYAKATFTKVDNTLDYLNGLDIIYPDNDGVVARVLGEPNGVFYGFKNTGIFQLSDFTWQNNSDPSILIKDRKYVLNPEIPTQTPTARPGDLKMQDISGPNGVPDGVVNDAYDRTVIGSPFPNFSYSFSFSLDFKGIDFNFLINGVEGRQLYDQGTLSTGFVDRTGNVTKKVADERWTFENPSTTNPRLTYENMYQSIRSSYYVQDASFLRIKNIEIGYTFPTKLIKKLSIDKFRIYTNIQNLYNFTNFVGFDPERSATTITSNSYPQTRVYNIGLNLEF